jgi:hypothetical protein
VRCARARRAQCCKLLEVAVIVLQDYLGQIWREIADCVKLWG